VRATGLATMAIALALAGATAAQADQGGGRPPARTSFTGDPWERLNRRGFAINQGLDRLIVRPLSILAKGLTPGAVGDGLHNFLANLHEPVVFINDILQIRPRKAAASLARMLVNSTVGVVGVIDVATRIGVPPHPNGFGDTLGRYGVGAGPYLFLPLLGPSDVRDLFGSGADVVSSPLFYIQYPYKAEVGVTLAVVGGLDARAEADSDLQTLLGDAADPYATLRSTYLQMRQGEIDEGRAPGALPPLDDPGSGSVEPGESPSPDPVNQPSALNGLPDDQGGRADNQVSGPLEQRHGDGEFWTEAKEGPDDRIGGLLDPDAHGGEDGRAAGRADQALDGQDPIEADVHAGQP